MFGVERRGLPGLDAERAQDGTTLIVPTRWQGETCYRICVVNPCTTVEALAGLLDDLALGPLRARSRGTTP